MGLQQIVAQNPQLLGMLMQIIARENRDNPLSQRIRNDPQAFQRLLAQSGGMGGMGGMGRMMGGRGGGNRGGGGQPQIRITEEENLIIQRLTAIGFSRQKALEAFLICDRNENAAANYLVEHGNEDDNSGPQT